VEGNSRGIATVSNALLKADSSGALLAVVRAVGKALPMAVDIADRTEWSVVSGSGPGSRSSVGAKQLKCLSRDIGSAFHDT